MESALTDQGLRVVRWQILAILSLIMVVTAFGRLNLWHRGGNRSKKSFICPARRGAGSSGRLRSVMHGFRYRPGGPRIVLGPRKTLTLAIPVVGPPRHHADAISSPLFRSCDYR